MQWKSIIFHILPSHTQHFVGKFFLKYLNYNLLTLISQKITHIFTNFLELSVWRLECDQKPANRIIIDNNNGRAGVCVCVCLNVVIQLHLSIVWSPPLHPFVSGKFCSPWMNSDQDELYHHQYYSQYHHCQTRSWRHLCVTIVLEVDRLSIKVIFGVLTISHHKCL